MAMIYNIILLILSVVVLGRLQIMRCKGAFDIKSSVFVVDGFVI